MDEGEGEGGDQMDQFHRNEAISAFSDEGFLGEEDDDYEYLYNDVNVGEGGPSAGIGGGGGLRVELAQASGKLNEMAAEQSGNNNSSFGGVGGMGQQGHGIGNVGSVENEVLMRQGGVRSGSVNGVGAGGGSGPMIGNGGGSVGVSGPDVAASGVEMVVEVVGRYCLLEICIGEQQMLNWSQS
ncbi:hypothetical protein CRYUN_Cryun13aG0032800 [Craigia yunnanensis]